MNRCSDASDTLRKKPGVSWVPALEDYFHTPESRARRPGIIDFTGFNLGFDPQMTLYSGNGINHDFCHDLFLRFLVILRLSLGCSNYPMRSDTCRGSGGKTETYFIGGTFNAETGYRG